MHVVQKVLAILAVTGERVGEGREQGRKGEGGGTGVGGKGREGVLGKG